MTDVRFCQKGHDELMLATVSNDATLKVWQQSGPREWQVTRRCSDLLASRIDVMMTEHLLRYTNGSLLTQKWQVICNLSGHSDCIRSVAWSPDDKSILTGSVDHTIKGDLGNSRSFILKNVAYFVLLRSNLPVLPLRLNLASVWTLQEEDKEEGGGEEEGNTRSRSGERREDSREAKLQARIKYEDLFAQVVSF